MSDLKIDRAKLITALEAASHQFTTMLQSLEPQEALRQVVGIDWTVGETAAHVLTVVRRGIGDMRRSTSPTDTANLNNLCLTELVERNPKILAELITSDMDIMLQKVSPRIADDKIVPFHAGSVTTFINALSIVLGEFLLHGLDITTTLGRPWTIDAQSASLVWRGAANLTPVWLKPGAANEREESYVFYLNGQAEPAVYNFKGGKLTISSDLPLHPTFEVRIEPLTLLLSFPYGRTTASDPAISRLAALFEPV